MEKVNRIFPSQIITSRFDAFAFIGVHYGLFWTCAKLPEFQIYVSQVNRMRRIFVFIRSKKQERCVCCSFSKHLIHYFCFDMNMASVESDWDEQPDRGGAAPSYCSCGM